MRMLTRKAGVVICIILVTIPIYWMTVFMTSNVYMDSSLEERIVDLRHRLQVAETQNMMRENELKLLRDQIAFYNLCKTNRNLFNNSGSSNPGHSIGGNESYPVSRTNRSLYIPSILSYLPFLKNNPNSLHPAFCMCKHRSATMVFGVPTVKREKESYLIPTLQHLVNGLDDKDDALIVVLVAEPTDMQYVKKVASEIQSKLPDEVKSGLIEVISPPSTFYPDFSKLRLTFNDPPARVKWRTKQNLDFAFLMMYAKSRGTYYTQLEDDVVARPLYSAAMKGFISSQTTDSWMMLEFSQLGFIGKTFRTRDLPFLVDFFAMFHNDKPVDWLLDDFLSSKYCNPEKSPQHCRKVIAQYRLRYKPSLFQHVGLHSSLKGKAQKLKDRDFGKGNLNVMLKSHKNPPADVRTSLTIYQKYSIERAYVGEAIFWGVNPEPDDTVEFHFKQPIKIKKFLFRTGNPEHPGDKFKNTTVEVLPRSHINDNGAIVENHPTYKLLPDGGAGYLIVGRFDSNGVGQGTVSSELGDISALRLHVLTKSTSWVIISEILIEVSR